VHLLTHGLLHLLGHDHVLEAAAARMEALESRLLLGAGYDDPYGQKPASHKSGGRTL
jgi:probable rRNA maturation factor